MKIATTLPEPSRQEREHSALLVARIKEAMLANGGSLPFRKYMQMALFEPGLGYYVAGKRKFGKSGDFVTAPEISSLFSFCIANQCLEILQQLGGGEILEFGAGSGEMASDILSLLERRDCLPAHYLILEVSPDLKQLQRQTFEQKIPHLLERIIWLERLPKEEFSGVVLGNEVLDAMPVDLFSIRQDDIFQHYISLYNNQLKDTLKPGPEKFLKAVARLAIESGKQTYTSEKNPGLAPWMQAVAGMMRSGVILLIDYGYVRKEYYHPDRCEGTLICHYKHRVHDDFLFYPGLQDITANVDFTAVAEAGGQAGLQLSGFTDQARFLIANGLETFLMDAINTEPSRQYELAQQVRTLTLPAEMGDRFKVIALNKSFHHKLQGFAEFDQSHRL